MTDAIWFDAPTPKYALFFAPLIRWLEQRGISSFVTTRFAPGYEEALRMLEHCGIAAHATGSYGGQGEAGKLTARLERQREFLGLFERVGFPEILVCGCVVESVQTAFGLGIPIAVFSDMPIRGQRFRFEDVTAVSKLTLPLADLVLHPFVVPSEVFHAVGVDPRTVRAYGFLDVVLWLQHLRRDESIDFRGKFNIPKDRPTVLVREEEYKAHYVRDRLPTIHDSIDLLCSGLEVNVVIIPRYEIEPLKREFAGRAFVLEEKIPPETFFPFIDMLIGGGGTMNLEAAYLGIPVISARSIQVSYDRFLIENGLMHWAGTANEVLEIARRLLAASREPTGAATGQYGMKPGDRPMRRNDLFCRSENPLEEIGGCLLEFLGRQRQRS